MDTKTHVPGQDVGLSDDSIAQGKAAALAVSGGDTHVLGGGVLVANDADYKRCCMLVHQTKRLSSPSVVITNHLGQKFPRLYHKQDGVAPGAPPADYEPSEKHPWVDEKQYSEFHFDRVLCDVPCSGDGTIRKAPDVWRKWNANGGNSLHRIQVQIANHGFSLLRVGGVLVYR